jgi:hypothetical protein
MTANALSSLIIRFLALGLGICGLTLLVRGLVLQSELDKMQDSFEALTGLTASASADAFGRIGGIGKSLGSMIRIFYMASSGCVVVAVVLYAASRKLGGLIARGLD